MKYRDILNFHRMMYRKHAREIALRNAILAFRSYLGGSQPDTSDRNLALNLPKNSGKVRGPNVRRSRVRRWLSR